jgi:hypothetical protein
MADNLTTTTTVATVPSGSVIATDDVGGVHYQKVKLDIGGDGAASILSSTNPLPVTPYPVTAGGLSVFNANTGDTYTALTNTAQAVKASAGQVYGWSIFNPAAATSYVLLYDVAAAGVTVGTTTAKMVIAIATLGRSDIVLDKGIPFATAIAIAAATTGGGNTAPATALEVMIFYK